MIDLSVVVGIDTDFRSDLFYPWAWADIVGLLLGREVELSLGERDVRIRVAIADLVAPGELLVE